MEPLSTRCRRYLDDGPPRHMTDYVPGSLTEIILEHGALGLALGEELSDVVRMLESYRQERPLQAEIDDPAVLAYLLEGAALVREVFEALGSGAVPPGGTR